MNYTSINMDAMKKDEILYKNLQKIRDDTREKEIQNISVQRAKDGSAITSFLFDQKGYRLNSLYNPQKESEKWAGQYTFKNLNSIVQMYGFGNGFFVRELLKRTKKNDNILIYEPSKAIFLHTLTYFDVHDILSDARVKIAVKGINEGTFDDSLRRILDIHNVKSQIPCIHPQYKELFQEEYISYLRVIYDANIFFRVVVNTVRQIAKLYVDLRCENMQYLQESSNVQSICRNIPKDIPVIVVLAGPSVEKAIEQLKEAKGKFVIFAVDRVVGYLLEQGVEPDFIVTLDATLGLEDYTDNPTPHIPILCVPTASLEILHHHKGQKIMAMTDEFFLMICKQISKDILLYETGTCVATFAFSTVFHLGFKKIVLVGQDLAYQGEYSHAGGIKENDPCYQDDYYVDGVQGGQVRTRYDWYEMRKWYQLMIAKNEECEVIDAKEEGAKIEGTIHMSLTELIDKYGDRPYSLYGGTDVLPMFSPEEWRMLKEELNRGVADLKKWKRLSKHGVLCCDRLIQNLNISTAMNRESKKLVKEINDAIEFISHRPIFAMISNFISTYARDSLVQIGQFGDNVKKNAAETYKITKKVFESGNEAVDYILPQYEKAMEKLKQEE